MSMRTYVLALITLMAVIALPGPLTVGTTEAAGVATDCCGGQAAWTTGNKIALGTSATPMSTLWFTVANGITSEVFFPRADIPNMQDMQYVVTDGSAFVDLERDDTQHSVSMPDERALEYTIVNTARSGRYRITNTYVTDAERATLLIQTHFESLDGGSYQLYLLANPSTAGDGINNDARWDPASNALLSSNTQTLFGTPVSVTSALRVSSGFVAHTNGYAAAASDCLVDLRAHKALMNEFDGVSHPGNVVQCGQIAVGLDTTFTVGLGYGNDVDAALAAVDGSLSDGFSAIEARFRSGWDAYLDGLKPAPASVADDTQRRRVYFVAVMALHAAEDKTHPGANVAALATPWGDFVNGNTLNDGYHRVWGRDLYQQATGLLAAGDSAQARRMAEFMWNRQYINAPTQGDGMTYQPGAFPRFSPVSGSAPLLVGCCEQFDQDAFAIILAWSTGLTDAANYSKIRTTANHIQSNGPDTTERWEEQFGKSPSSIAAEIAGLITAADIARVRGDDASAANWEATADAWRNELPGWTLTSNGFWGGHHYYERLNSTSNPNDNSTICFQEGCFFARDVTDFGFLDLVRLGVRAASDSSIANSIGPTGDASDGNSSVAVRIGNNVYFHRYVHDNYGESNADCQGYPVMGPNRFGRVWPVLSGERGQYEIANGRSANVYLQSMANAANDGYFIPEQIWDLANPTCYELGTPTGSASPLMWAEGQYVRLAQAIDEGYNADTPSVVRARHGGEVSGPILGPGDTCVDVSSANTDNGAPIQIWECNRTDAQRFTWNTGDGAIHVLGKCLDVAGGATANGTPVQLWECNGSGAQQWRYLGWNRLVNPQSARCLDDLNASTTLGTRLRIRDCDTSPAQVFRLP
jgi:glucoamylase